MHVLTPQFFSKIYYGSAVWLGPLGSKDWKRIESLHYSALRVACHDYRNKVHREILDHDYKRATPREWSNYSHSREMIRIFNTQCPPELFSKLQAQSYQVSRPGRVLFFDKSRHIIGMQEFCNRSASISKLTSLLSNPILSVLR